MDLIKVVRLIVLMFACGMPWLAFADDDEEHGSNKHEANGRVTASAGSDPIFKAECSICHMLYPPGLLPARSWVAILSKLEHHFGSNAEMDKATVEKLTVYLTKHASDRGSIKRGQKFNPSKGADDVPLRITETTNFKRKHHEVRAEIWKRKSIGSPSNCVACHAGSEAGNFSEDAVRIPK